MGGRPGARPAQDAGGRVAVMKVARRQREVPGAQPVLRAGSGPVQGRRVRLRDAARRRHGARRPEGKGPPRRRQLPGEGDLDLRRGPVTAQLRQAQVASSNIRIVDCAPCRGTRQRRTPVSPLEIGALAHYDPAWSRDETSARREAIGGTGRPAAAHPVHALNVSARVAYRMGHMHHLAMYKRT